MKFQVDTEVIDSDEDVCPGNKQGTHVPDWRSLTIEWDGDEAYIDVCCANCGRSGCVGTQTTLEKEIMW
jgi:hypothetical protein